jgi:hypothetical protein
MTNECREAMETANNSLLSVKCALKNRRLRSVKPSYCFNTLANVFPSAGFLTKNFD